MKVGILSPAPQKWGVLRYPAEPSPSRARAM